MENRLYQTLVAEFMLAAGQQVNNEAVILTEAEAQFRERLFQEELRELKDAIKAQDKVEQLDALADMMYIALGTTIAKGQKEYVNRKIAEGFFERSHTAKTIVKETPIGEVIETVEGGDRVSAIQVPGVLMLVMKLGFTFETFDEAFHRVHESNMSKFCNTERQAQQTLEDYKSKGIETVWVQRGEKYVILRAEDGKVMKSIDYKPVDLTDLV